MGLFYDSTYLLVILAALISMAVSARMNTIFSKYQTVRSYSGMTGRDEVYAARNLRRHFLRCEWRTRGGDAHSASGRHLRCDRPPRIR